METLHPQTIIAIGALVSVLGFVFYALLYPVRHNQDRLEKRMDSFDSELKDLKAGQAKLDTKLDHLIARSK